MIPGGLIENSQIKILVCYVVGALRQPLSHDGLLEALSGRGYANYFECANAISELIEAHHISLDEEGHYITTDSGREIASLLAEDVALTVRERVLDYADHLARREQNSSSHRATIEKLPVGYRLRCSVSDRNCEIFALEVLLPTMADAHDAKEIFLDDAEELVRINLECLTGGQL